ncbi:exported hypothetical protein [Cupriavidus oxalaticus]|uniref:Uncharacterized protein n=1 Tax=Cupriavidus oxalaticus TaxID=96344 RepID=A0A976G9B8_9BURK|nr:exported hypothetical protein [Cupriavidus oxalaticus]
MTSRGVMSMLPTAASGQPGWSRSSVHATIAPIDQPTTTTSASPRWLTSAAASRASAAMVVPVPCRDSPWPAWSGAITRNPARASARWPSKASPLTDQPCSSSSGRPSPASRQPGKVPCAGWVAKGGAGALSAGLSQAESGASNDVSLQAVGGKQRNGGQGAPLLTFTPVNLYDET